MDGELDRNGLLALGPRITVLPVIHGSGDFAIEVRRWMLEASFDCLAVPLPPSFAQLVERAIDRLPVPSMVIQRETGWPLPSDDSDLDSELEAFGNDFLLDESDDSDGEIDFGTIAFQGRASYVPIDPCQPVIAALRGAIGEHIPRAYIDLETSQYETYSTVLPDPYALKRVRVDQFAAAILPSLGPVPDGQPTQRVRWMAERLKELQTRHQRILCVCAATDWPELRRAFFSQDAPSEFEPEAVEPCEQVQPDARSLLFLLGELPFITGLYERARRKLEDDSNLSIDGVKELLLIARDSYRREFRRRARKISPQRLRTCLQYIRNLTLIHRRLTPDLYRIVVGAKQVLGDSYALHVAETAATYPMYEPLPVRSARLSLDMMRLDDGELLHVVNRLPGIPMEWRSVELQRRPDPDQLRRWTMQWNPFQQCSWPPEDELIENFRTRVTERALQIMGADLIHTEKFTTSVKDGIDIRDTLRNWHTGDIYVKVMPPSRGKLNAVVMLFDSPADPRDYPWRSTWFAEHQNESTLAFFASDYSQRPVGPGICCATYGGALFLFPPRAIPDIWNDPRLNFTETLEERLLAAACLHSQSDHIALLAPGPPGAGWRRLARRFRRKWVHVPLSHFSEETVHRLRDLHVLNGKHIRSFADHFIRKP